MTSRLLSMAAAAGLASVQALAATAAAPGPWAKVPALPTACYSSQDQWWDQNNAANEAVLAEHYKQNDINDAIRQNATDAFGADPMAIAQRLQQQMMNDPQNAQKYIEQMNRETEEAQAEAPVQQEKEKQLEAESRILVKQYQSALTKAMDPAEARWTALKKRMGIPMDSRGPGEAGVPNWVWAEWHAILRERDQAYVANCSRWWSSTGPAHAYMKRYKDYLVLERIPFEKKGDEGKLEHYRTLNVSTKGWRTTTDYEAAEDYMNMASSLFGERKHQPFCAGGACPP